MKLVDQSCRENKAIRSVITEFYLSMQQNRFKQVNDMLSPNFAYVIGMERQDDKYKNAFKFGRQIYWTNLFDLKEIKEGLLEAIVIICLAFDEKSQQQSDEKMSDDDIRYCGDKIQFVSLKEHWLIEDITIYNEFGANEFRKYLLQQQAE